MKKIILICNLILILSISACSINQVVDNEITIEENNTESTYDLNEAIKNAKCVIEYPDIATIDDFDTVKFGKYEQDGDESNGKEDIEWIVLAKNNGEALLFSKFIIDCRQFIDVISFMHKLDDKTIDINDRDAMYDYINQDNETNRKSRDYFELNIKWENSELRNWLNNDFIVDAFNDDEKKYIVISNLLNEGNKEWTSNIGMNTYDQLFCLSQKEVDTYFNQTDMEIDNFRLATKGTKYSKMINDNEYRLFINNDERWNKGNSPFWLRTAGGPRDNIIFIDDNGSVNTIGIDIGAHSIGVRPAMWIKYK